MPEQPPVPGVAGTKRRSQDAMTEPARTPTIPSPEPEPEPSPALTAAVERGVPAWAVIGIFVLLLVGAMAYARNFLMPVVLALLLKLVFTPPQRALERWGLPGGLAAFAIVGGLVAAVATALVLLAAPAAGWVNRAPLIGMEIEAKLGQLRWATEGMREAAAQMEAIAAGEADPEVQRVVVEDSGPFALALTLPQVAAQMVFTLVLLFFLLASGDMFYEKIVHVMPTFRDKRTAIRIAHDIEQALAHYLSTITLINFGLGMAVGIAMWLLGMPNPVLFGVVAFLLNYIPYLGAIAGVAIVTIVGIVSLPQLGQAITVGLVYFLLTSIEGQLVTPYFVGRRLRLNTVVVFVSVTLFAWLWSVVGMLVATPLLVMLRTFCDHIPRLQGYGDFLSARGAERERDRAAEETG
jgi:predicted PurR-regulated permease PerM